MRHVLFVGEDQPLWQEIRKASTNFSSQWTAKFAQNAPEALACAAEARFDAVVADVQLFDMSGVDLLDAILQRQPQALRILVSEQADLQNTVKCIGKAHHHLLKPCDMATLIHALEQGLTCNSWFPGKNVQQLLGRLRWVPSPPNVYFRITMEMDSPTASVETIGQIIRQDPPTTAKVLQLANSAVFGLHLQVNEPGEAVAYLGLEATRTLVLMAHTFSEFDRLPRTGFSIDELWFHSVRVGEFARQIASFEEQPSDVAEQAYAAGLLHDLGKVLFAANLPVPFGQALLLAKEQGLPLYQAETQLLGASHAEVGASLLAIWDLPAPIVEAVALHHQPSLSVRKEFQPLAAVHAADVFAQRIVPGQPATGIPQLDQTYLAGLRLLERAELWRRHCEERDLSAAL